MGVEDTEGVIIVVGEEVVVVEKVRMGEFVCTGVSVGEEEGHVDTLGVLEGLLSVDAEAPPRMDGEKTVEAVAPSTYDGVAMGVPVPELLGEYTVLQVGE